MADRRTRHTVQDVDFEHATVADAMHPGILTCAPQATLREVARTMADHQVHAVAVLGIGDGGREHLVWGIVSDLDLVRALQAPGAERTTAGEVAATEPVTVDATEPLAAAARVMGEHDVHHVVVVSGADPRPIGIVSSLDVARVAARGAGEEA